MKKVCLIILVVLITGCNQDYKEQATDLYNKASDNVSSVADVEYVAKAKDSVLNLYDELEMDKVINEDKNNVNLSN